MVNRRVSNGEEGIAVENLRKSSFLMQKEKQQSQTNPRQLYTELQKGMNHYHIFTNHLQNYQLSSVHMSMLICCP